MALCCLRRSLTLSSSSLMRRSRVVLSSFAVLQQSQAPTFVSQNHHNNNYLKSPICWFRSSPAASARYNNNNNDDDDKIGPDTILFEGCDYNHWLITMDFPKDPKPTAEEMVETYVQTLAKVVGSVEEAKKRMYACSTTTYQGFQAIMTEEMSEKFRGLPGVVFILPDSYIDPVNKEYGGDKYDNGVITHRPPPVQYGRGGRYGDRNRPQGSAQGDVRKSYGPGDGSNYGGPQRNYPPQRTFGPNPTGQGDERSFPAQQNYATQQNYGPSPTGQGERGNPMTGNRDYTPGGRGPMPSYQRDLPQAGRTDYVPPGNRDVRGDNRNFGPPASGDYRQGAPLAGGDYRQGAPPAGGDYRQEAPPASGDYRQGAPFASGDYRQGAPSVGGDYRQGAPPASGDYRQGAPPAGGDYRQGAPPAGGDYRQEAPPASGDYRQGAPFANGDYRQGAPSASGDYRQGAGSRYDQNIGSGAGQRFPQMEQRDGLQGEQQAFSPMGQVRNNQGQGGGY